MQNQHAKHRAQYCAGMRQGYDLAEPKLYMQHHYIQKCAETYSVTRKLIPSSGKLSQKSIKVLD